MQCAMENTLAEGEAQLLAQRAAMTEATSKQEVSLAEVKIVH